MQVTHTEDFVSHAILGGQQSIGMGIDDSPEFFLILSSTLYSDQILAVVREVICNAWDAHIDAGISDRPIEITLDNYVLNIRDFGNGIPHDKIGEIYGTYGKSTKKDDKRSTGGFGLGCKSPFAYTDNFEVVSRSGGNSTVYRMSKSSPENGGRPGIVPIVSIPTEESGITVSINIRPQDIHRFELLIARIVRNGEIRATFNGKELETFNFGKAKHKFCITKEKISDSNQTISIRYGNVIYPLEVNAAYADEYSKCQHIVHELGGAYRLILMAEADTISITPSRESLSLQEKTISTVKTLLKNFINYLPKDRLDRYATQELTVKRKQYLLSKVEDFKEMGELDKTKFIKENLRESGRGIVPSELFAESNTGDIFSRQQFIQDYLRDIDHHNSSAEAKLRERKKRFNALSQPPYIDKMPNKGLFLSFCKMLNRVSAVELEKGFRKRLTIRNETWFQKNCLAPITGPMRKTDLSLANLKVYHAKRNSWRYTHNIHGDAEFFPASSFQRSNPEEYVWYTRGIVVMTHSLKKIDDLTMHSREFKAVSLGKESDFLVYHCSRGKKATEEAREFFSGLNGINFVDLTNSELKEKLFEHCEWAKEPRKPPRKGWAPLSLSVNGIWFSQQAAREVEQGRILEPLAYTTLKNRSEYDNERSLPNFPREESAIIFKMWGDKIAVIFNESQTEKVKKTGAVKLNDFVRDQCIYEVLNNPRIHNWLRNSVNRLSKRIHNIPDDFAAWTRLVVEIGLFPGAEQPALTEEEKGLIHLFKYLVDIRDFENEYGSSDGMLQKCHRYYKAAHFYNNIPIGKELLKAAEVVIKSSDLKFLDFAELRTTIRKGEDEDEKNRAIKLIKNTLVG